MFKIKKKYPNNFFYEDFQNSQDCKHVVLSEANKQDTSNLYHFPSPNNDLSLLNTHKNIYYKGIYFSNVIFDGTTFDHVCFHNCVFLRCKFININTSSNAFALVFNFCDFYICKFENCNFTNTTWSIGKLNTVTFENSILINSIFHRNSFNEVKFSKNSKLSRTCFLSPSNMFDIDFDDTIKIDSRSDLSPFDYNDDINLSNKPFKFKADYIKLRATYYNFERLFEKNFVIPRNANCYYERKKAETRSKATLKAIPSYLNEWITGYGEYPFKSFIIMGIIILIFSFIYLFTGFNTGGENDCLIIYNSIPSKIVDASFAGNWLHSLYFSFFTFITIGQGSSYPATYLTQFFSCIELLIGAILMTLFTGTLFRKMTK